MGKQGQLPVAALIPIEVANRPIDSITDRFFLPASHPYLRRARDDEFGGGSGSFPIGEHVES